MWCSPSIQAFLPWACTTACITGPPYLITPRVDTRFPVLFHSTYCPSSPNGSAKRDACYVNLMWSKQPLPFHICLPSQGIGNKVRNQLSFLWNETQITISLWGKWPRSTKNSFSFVGLMWFLSKIRIFFALFTVQYCILTHWFLTF